MRHWWTMYVGYKVWTPPTRLFPPDVDHFTKLNKVTFHKKITKH